MIAMLGGIGLDPRWLGALGGFAGLFASEDDRAFLEGPVVVHQSPWTETLPKWMPEQVRWERSEIVFGLAPKGLIVGPTEIAAVMYPRTFESPMRSELADLYLWAGVEASCRNFKKATAQMWADMNTKPIETAEVLQPYSRLWGIYQPLAHEIRRKVIAHAKLNRRTEYLADKVKHGDRKRRVEPRPEVVFEQLQFGDVS
jgi:hypothetical protein